MIRKKLKIALIITVIFHLTLIFTLIILYLSVEPYSREYSFSEDEVDGQGRAFLKTERWITGSKGNSISIDFKIGRDGIKKNGGIRVSFGHILNIGGSRRVYVPFDLINSSNILSGVNFFEDVKVSVKTKDVKIKIKTPSRFEMLKKLIGYIKYKRSNDSRDNLMRSIDQEIALDAIVEEGELKKGDVVNISMGGSDGFDAPKRETKYDVIIQTDGDGNGTYDLISDIPCFEVVAVKARRFHVTTRFNPIRGWAVKLRIVAVDDFYIPNRIVDYAGTVKISSNKPIAGLRSEYTFEPWDKGLRAFSIIFPGHGFYRITVEDENGIKGVSHYIDTRKHEKRIFFGDMHTHSVISYDAGRESEYIFERQRDVEGLDFSCLAENGPDIPPFVNRNSIQCITPDEWSYIRQLSERYNDPKEYITLNGYEWTSGIEGYSNIYFSPDIENPPLFLSSVEYPPSAIAGALHSIEYFVISHPALLNNVNALKIQGPFARRQRLLEIYNANGAYEYSGNPFPASGDNEMSRYSGSFVQDALAKGWKLGFIGSGSMYNLAYTYPPYKPGLAAVFSEELTQKEIFQGLYNCETYATTGVKIGVRFSCNGYPMGSEIRVDKNPEFMAEILGTAKIEHIELVKFDGSVYKAVLEQKPGKDITAFKFVDKEFSKKAFYYLRITQVDKNMAWTSPVWVERK